MRLILAGAQGLLILLTVALCEYPDTSAFAREGTRGQSIDEGVGAPRPPVATRRPQVFNEFGRQRIDNYYWLKERTSADVLAYLQAENAYADALLAPLRPSIADLHAELQTYVDGTTLRAPFLDGGYVYETRYEKGGDYPIIERHRDRPGAPREVVIDGPKLAAGHAQFNLNKWVVSPDGALVAYAVDYSGNNEHHIYVRSITTGELIDDLIDDVDDDIVFSTDGRSLFYISDSKVWRHNLGDDPDIDTLIYEETDRTFSLSLSVSKSRKYIFINIDHEQTSEVRFFPADAEHAPVLAIEPRRHGVRYYADHLDDRFYLRTNLEAPDYRIVTAPGDAPSAANWMTLIPGRPGRFISGMEIFKDHIAIQEEQDANVSLRVMRLSDRHELDVVPPGEIGVASIDPRLNLDAASHSLQFVFEGPLNPKGVYRFGMDDGTLVPVYQGLSAENFPASRYVAKHVETTAPDGERIPITIVYRPDLIKPEGSPTLISGYGAYGSSYSPGFASLWYPLIDRGFVFAIAHVRGGRERGQRWYDQGRLLNKKNTFRDFIAVTEALVAQGIADPKRVFAHGASAGGLLMGGIANMRPDLYAGIVAEVPYLDVVTSMGDPDVPLTTYEYEEWGNPANSEQYEAMLAYSPYDNVAPHPYPPMLVTAGFKDTQVDYREAAKWVAKLRATKTDDNDLILRVDMNSGHLGPSGRVRPLEPQALIIAWLLSRAQ